MKNYLLLVSVLMFLLSCEERPGKYSEEQIVSKKSSSESSSKTAEKGKSTVKVSSSNSFSSSFENPSYIGGPEELKKYVKNNIILPDSIKLTNIAGKVTLCLTIDKEGEMLKYDIISTVKHCPDCTKEALRIIKSIPKWKPAYSYLNGTKVPYTEKLVVEVDFKK